MHIITAINSTWRVRAVHQIIGIIEEVDAVLNIPLGMDFTPSDLLVSSLNVLLVFYHCFNEPQFIYSFLTFIVATNIWLAMSQFSVLASLINSRLEGACESLDELKMRSDSPYKDQKVAILSDDHNKLCDAGEILHTAFSSLLTVLVAVCFIGIIETSFYLYTVQKRNKNFDIRLLLLHDETIWWIVFFLIITCKTAASSSHLTQKVIKLS
ncbi:unnamed protein product [Nezara viridula]|uniref:Uncharacterized protein n=1 Tax=Nezara viridula TaxID=85310 RepID=A0A9P0H940_NEZVI|nr:unnamed protein product [Nezara viridula]